LAPYERIISYHFFNRGQINSSNAAGEIRRLCYTNPEYTQTIRAGSSLAIFDPYFAGEIFDPTYMTSKPGKRVEFFYFKDEAEPEVIDMDEATKETLTLGEIISIAKYDRNETLNIQILVLLILGDQDFTRCGSDFECTDHDSVIKYENQFSSEAARVEIHLLQNTGHVINLHRTAPECYQILLDWVNRRVQ